MSADLEALIRAEIVAGGPIPFARFMDLALYEPELGYYTSTARRPTREGDFLTAPELHPIFGQAIANQLDEAWDRLARPDPFVLVEYGAGSGALASAIEEGLELAGSGLRDVLGYEPVEVNQHRLAELRQRADEGGWAGHLLPGHPSYATPQATCILANEFVDALPVHRLTWSQGRLLEIFVDIDSSGAFSESLDDPSSPRLAATATERFGAGGHAPLDSQRFEVCLALETWVSEASGRLGSGVLLVIDYGHDARDLYAPTRSAGTVRAYAGHGVSDDPYRDVGERDITAHVDLTALRDLAGAAGLPCVGDTVQSAFLLGCGLEDLFEAARADPNTSASGYLELRSSIRRLLDPRALGGFRVLAFSRGLPVRPPLRGFADRTKSMRTPTEAAGG